jgi:agmatine/peptidylarginine deiminase
MPAEWEWHGATWLAWPHNIITWPDQLPQVQDIFLSMIASLHVQETVHLLVNDTATAVQVKQQLHRYEIQLERVVLHEWPIVDAWLRDSGPIFVTTVGAGVQPVAMSDWLFNAWGGKYVDLQADNDVPQCMAAFLDIPRFEPGIVLEGGSIDVNGQGSCLTTEQCLLNPNRNPHGAPISSTTFDYLGIVISGSGRALPETTRTGISMISHACQSDNVVCWKRTRKMPTTRSCRQLSTPASGDGSDGHALQIIPLPTVMLALHLDDYQPAMPTFTLPTGCAGPDLRPP